MELTSSPMTERQRNYRANYRYRIAGWYNGWIHVLVIYVIGFTALSVYFGNISNLRLAWWRSTAGGGITIEFPAWAMKASRLFDPAYLLDEEVDDPEIAPLVRLDLVELYLLDDAGAVPGRRVRAASEADGLERGVGHAGDRRRGAHPRHRSDRVMPWVISPGGVRAPRAPGGRGPRRQDRKSVV